MIHQIKCWPVYFQHIVTGKKSFEFRKDDRPYAVGDVLRLDEWDPSTAAFTGRTADRRVTYLAHGGLIPDGYVVMSIVTIATP
jgi:hypothetical protein